MDFEFDDAQAAIARLCAEVLAGAGENPWKALGEAGLLDLAVPERLGGDGLGMLETAIVLTEIGRRAVPVPALATLALATLPIARFAPDPVQDGLLARGHVLTAAVSGLSLRRAPLGAEPGLYPNTQCRTVEGVAHGVPYAVEAHRILAQCPDRLIAVLDPGAAGVSVTPMHTSSGSPEATVRCEAVEPEAVFEGDLTYYALTGAAAVADGLLRGALDLTAAHVGSRHQFGRPLATFQAVALQIADVYIAWRTTHLTALSACVNPADAAVAGYWLRNEAMAAMRTCHHLHGGIGLDLGYALHRYSAMLKDLRRLVAVADAHPA